MVATPILVYATDFSGNVLSEAKLFTYEAGTTTNRATYTDSGLGTPAANPVVCDSAGRAIVWMDSTLGDYKLILKDAAEANTYFQQDNIDASAITPWLAIYPANAGDQSLNTTDSPTFAGLTLTGALTGTSASFSGNVDLNGNDLILDSDADSYFHATADDQLALVVGGTTVQTWDATDTDVSTLNGITLSFGGATLGQALGYPSSTTTLEPYTPAGGGDTLAAANETITGAWTFSAATTFADGTEALPGAAWGASKDYGFSHDSGNNRMVWSAAGTAGVYFEDDGSGNVSWGHPGEWTSTLFPDFKVNSTLYSRGPGLQTRHIDVGDPGDTPEIAMLIADGTATSPSARGSNYPGAYLYWLPYDTSGNVRPSDLYGPSSEAEVTEVGNGTNDTVDCSSLTQVGGDYAVFEVTASSTIEAQRTLTTAQLLVKDTDYTVSGSNVVRSAGNLPSGSYLRIFKREDIAMTGPFYGRPAQDSTWLTQTSTKTERGGARVFYATKNNEAAVRPYGWFSNDGNFVVVPWTANMGTDGTYPDTNNVGTLIGGFSGSQWTNGVNDIDGWSSLNALCMDEADGGALSLRYGADFNNYGFDIKYDQSADSWRLGTLSGSTTFDQLMRFDAANDLVYLGSESNTNRYASFDSSGRGTIRFNDNSNATVLTLENNGITAADHGAHILCRLAAGAGAPVTAGYMGFVSENSTHTGSTADGRYEVAVALDASNVIRQRIQSDGTTLLGINNSVGGLQVSPVASQVNYVDIVPAATSNNVKVAAAGSDSNIDLDLNGKGAGEVNLAAHYTYHFQVVGNNSSGSVALKANNPAGEDFELQHAQSGNVTVKNTTDGKIGMRIQASNGDNYIRFTGATTNPIIEVLGTGPNADLNLAALGSGNINITTGNLEINGTQVVGAQGAAVADTSITYTTNDPSITPDNSVTIADGSAPTVSELLELCVELKNQIETLKGRLNATGHGLIAT